jgi:hypothetical protein
MPRFVSTIGRTLWVSRRNAIDELKRSAARLFREGSCDLIPHRERLLERKVRVDRMLDLVKCKAEFTPRTGRSSEPRLNSPRGKCRAQ